MDIWIGILIIYTIICIISSIIWSINDYEMEFFAAFFLCFIGVPLSPLIFIGILIYLFAQYANYCKENHCPILTYRQIKKFYAFNPDVWQITSDREGRFTLIQYDEKTIFVKSFFGYWLARIFINRSKKISKKNNDDIKQVENTQNLLNDIRTDIERRKEESDAMIKLCEKEIQEITLRLQNENKQKEETT